MNIARGNRRLPQAVKLLRAGCAAARILLESGRSSSTYISVDANKGMYLTFLYCLCARARSSRVFLHHHTYSHISERNRAMAWIVSAAGADAVHISICREMSRALSSRYPKIRHTENLSNIFHIGSAEQGARPEGSGTEIVLGHMSRLSCEKGVQTCLEVYRNLKRRGIPAVLRLAGRFADAKTRDLVQAAAAGDSGIQHLGEISGQEKEAFFQSLGFFLFPSAYKNETQGIVNLEALSHGVPVLAVGRACLKSDLSRQPEWLFADQAAFTGRVPDYIADNLDRYPELRRNAAALFEDLKGESGDQLERISDLLVPLEA
ncbi:glycosyltransferase [Leisingera daeponensis]|uniref:Glycosyltransferase n=1 Tax=Leisingera daeponensis TaxID=405746 RepID=A0ABS7NIE2_9RHOB|nr:glycosyltransferase [Leisingera daeponensis]MBY6140971.1 glycosyltransferase [Leisingera daeponensis]